MEIPSVRLKFDPPAAGSRYQSWKFDVEPALMNCAYGAVKSSVRSAVATSPSSSR